MLGANGPSGVKGILQCAKAVVKSAVRVFIGPVQMRHSREVNYAVGLESAKDSGQCVIVPSVQYQQRQVPQKRQPFIEDGLCFVVMTVRVLIVDGQTIDDEDVMLLPKLQG